MRGAHKPEVIFKWHLRGSSPHAWGTPLNNFLNRRKRRFIPTCVGHTFASALSPRSQSVHPHMRGAHVCCRQGAAGLCGSSPHAWGTRFRRGQLMRSERFIPTCVGHTCRTPAQNPQPTVHPHMRGAHTPPSRSTFAPIGSSPHAWGTPQKGNRKSAELRFIPTCVGHTQRASQWAVHPHMRGAHHERAD